jgi:hypothetical protein
MVAPVELKAGLLTVVNRKGEVIEEQLRDAISYEWAMEHLMQVLLILRYVQRKYKGTHQQVLSH